MARPLPFTARFIERAQRLLPPLTHTPFMAKPGHLGRLLDPLTQDACAFYDDLRCSDDYTGVVVSMTEGERLAAALGDKKAIMLKNHGHLTVGESVDEALWWYVTLERSCQVQLMAEAAGTPSPIPA